MEIVSSEKSVSNDEDVVEDLGLNQRQQFMSLSK